MKKRVLIIAFTLLVLVSILPTLFNVLLIARYEFGNEFMTRQSGEYGQLNGEWKFTYDEIPCGFDTRTEWHLVMDQEDKGMLYIASYWDKYLYPGGSQVGTYASLLPYNKSTVFRDTCHVSRVNHNLVLNKCYASDIIVEDTLAVLKSLGPNFTIDDIPYLYSTILHYEVKGDRLYIGEVMQLGESTEKYGLTYSPSNRLRDALAWW
jgi:hypothetical protein